MGKLSIKFHPLFIILSFVLIYFGWFEEFLIYFSVLCLHEFAHYFVAKRLGYVLNKVIFMPYGVGLGGKNQTILPKHEIVIACAGPVLNLVLAVVCICFWWVVPISYAYTQFFVISNLTLGFFNLLPVFPLDGGRVVVCLLSEKLKRIKAYKIMKVSGFIFSAIFAVMFFISVFSKVNLTFFFISFFLFSSCFGNDANIYFERTHVQNFKKKISKPMLVKTYVVSSNTPVYKMLKYINSGNYTLFYLLEGNKLKKVLTETEVLSVLDVNNK